MRGSPGASSCTPGCVATQSINRRRPSPRRSGCRPRPPRRMPRSRGIPGEDGVPRPVQCADVDAPELRARAAGLVGVARRAPSGTHQDDRCGVGRRGARDGEPVRADRGPSKEMIVQSEGVPGTCVADTGLATGRWHGGGHPRGGRRTGRPGRRRRARGEEGRADGHAEHEPHGRAGGDSRSGQHVPTITAPIKIQTPNTLPFPTLHPVTAAGPSEEPAAHWVRRPVWERSVPATGARGSGATPR